ncbi:hypothetical protein GLOTRDRAFT_117970 [Gloeophyllum trabeum ATCC 11539]|uniref:Protein kinase domain-containing protein n=1 Tax=Gloeophyllum trabeum (strain ATCC 11539 / FP-39264 / Madison 617) TaxID=670483 RepID=S7PVI9_GLOTA|nr:uncharacterized protein GLOTRDRAFT_117970 [Gloeophyllum trabeum ATCC 11539]EPQ51651.1 hypothetical protein GLOTRDRAFT_117970 [Gloeophyllum trabeum ATCC 11539]
MLNDCDQEKVARYFGPDGPVEELLHKRSISPILEVLKECNREMSRDTKELETATAFIQRCIALRPSDRASATELLKDPWLSSEPIWGAHAFLDHNPKEDTGSTLIHVLTSWKLAEIACYSGTLAATAWFVWSIIS